MPELDPFETRLTAAVRGLAAGADTRVDAAAIAERAIGRRRPAPRVWIGLPIPVPASVLVALALLLALLAWSMQGGAPWARRTSVLSAPAPTATLAAATAAPTRTPVPTTSGTGDQLVTGTETGNFQVTAFTQTKVGSVTQMRGGVVTSTFSMNDARVSGKMTCYLSLDEYTTVAPEWGTCRLENAGGAWEGNGSGASWNAGNAADGSGWLIGSGAYKGFTFYFHHTYGLGEDLNVQGIIYPGSPPTP